MYLPEEKTIRGAIAEMISDCDLEDLIAPSMIVGAALVFTAMIVGTFVFLCATSNVEEAWYGDEHVYIFRDKDGTHVLQEVPNSDSKADKD